MAKKRVKEPPPTSNSSRHLVVLQTKPSDPSNPTSRWLKLLNSPSCPWPHSHPHLQPPGNPQLTCKKTLMNCLRSGDGRPSSLCPEGCSGHRARSSPWAPGKFRMGCSLVSSGAQEASGSSLRPSPCSVLPPSGSVRRSALGMHCFSWMPT